MNYQYETNKIYADDDKGELMAEAAFNNVSDGVIDITHIYVSSVLRGQGVAGQLMELMVEYMRKNKLKSKASCSYANSWLQKNKEAYADVIADGIDDQPIACKIDGKH
ncbi:MAG: GNAT family N-acetyltransferase [Clostridiales bacterium GWF2_38_85]|nr:MAG: GNAT family N-acetyltransferase [Clostridiales bacterium GWF2_38_85]HBL83315.1 N-acetyltransferase [Clostridiales bacterium]